MERRHPDDTTPRVEDLFAAGIAEMQAAPEPPATESEKDTPTEPTLEPAPAAPPVNYTGGTQAKAADVMYVEGRQPRAPAPKAELVERPTVDLADDDDIAW